VTMYVPKHVTVYCDKPPLIVPGKKSGHVFRRFAPIRSYGFW